MSRLFQTDMSPPFTRFSMEHLDDSARMDERSSEHLAIADMQRWAADVAIVMCVLRHCMPQEPCTAIQAPY
jgi:hypothetical protein